MSIEQHLAELTAAIIENTAAIKASGSTAGATTVAATTTAAAKTSPRTSAAKTTATKEPAKKATTVEEALAALTKLKDDFSIEDAREVLQKHGYKKMSEITADKADDVFGDVEAAHARLTAAASSVEVDSDEGL